MVRRANRWLLQRPEGCTPLSRPAPSGGRACTTTRRGRARVRPARTNERCSRCGCDGSSGPVARGPDHPRPARCHAVLGPCGGARSCADFNRDRCARRRAVQIDHRVSGTIRLIAPRVAAAAGRRVGVWLVGVGSPRGVSPRGSHGTERDRLQSFRSSHPLHRYARIHAQCAKSSGSLAVSPRHQALNRFQVRSRLYFFRAHRIK